MAKGAKKFCSIPFNFYTMTVISTKAWAHAPLRPVIWTLETLNKKLCGRIAGPEDLDEIYLNPVGNRSTASG